MCVWVCARARLEEGGVFELTLVVGPRLVTTVCVHYQPHHWLRWGEDVVEEAEEEVEQAIEELEEGEA